MVGKFVRRLVWKAKNPWQQDRPIARGIRIRSQAEIVSRADSDITGC